MRIKRNCKNCSTEFIVRADRELTSFWCSKKCWHKREFTIEERKKMSDCRKGILRGRKPTILQRGYVFLYLPNHYNASVRGYVAEHRKVMSDFMGRELTSGEVVHHLNEVITDNRIENLVLCESAGQHTKKYHPKALQKGLAMARLKPLTKIQIDCLKLGRRGWNTGKKLINGKYTMV